MDMQGTPIGSSNQGTKNTTDPEALNNPKIENPGPLTTDSLAAESHRANGVFASNPSSEPLSVAGANSTFATTDTSNATTLPPAPDAQTRDAQQEEGSKTKYPEALGGQAKGQGGGPTYLNTSSRSGDDARSEQRPEKTPFGTSDPDGDSHGVSGSEAARKTASSNPNQSSDASTSNVPAAPGYVSNVVSAPSQGGKPHGKNLTEGGFDADDAKNASFTSEIGARDDPGRLAEEQLQKNTQSVSGGTGPREGLQEGGGVYGGLSGEQDA